MFIPRRLPAARIARTDKSGRRHNRRGQSVVEFALILPVLLLLLMGTIDFGRVFLGWVNLNNTARIAANYAASNAVRMNAGNAAAIATYQSLIVADAKTTNCTPDPIANPSFPNGTALGGEANVTLTCDFAVITPIIGSLFPGGVIEVGATAKFPIRSGVVTGVGGGGATAPQAVFDATPLTGSAPLTVTFTDQSTGGPSLWQWDFGDNTTFDGQNPGSHAYNQAGSYLVTLTVTNGLVSDTATKTVVVAPSVGPVAIFTATPTSGPVPLTVSFQDASTGDPVLWEWDFNGDGTVDFTVDLATMTAQNPVPQSYGVARTYRVTLKVTDKDGLNSTTFADVTAAAVVPMCVVPDFFHTETSAAQATWQTAGFKTTVIFKPLDGTFKINDQSLSAGSSQRCDQSVITLYDKNQH